MITKRMRRVGILLAAMTMSVYLWGCSNLAPTGVPMDESLQPSAEDAPTGASTEGGPTEWW